MSEKESLDIGRVVGLIMENPQIIEQISALVNKKEEEPKEEPSEAKEVSQVISPSGDTYSAPSLSRSNRAHLLGALKPYVSEERAKAIDSMISIADILDMMRTR